MKSRSSNALLISLLIILMGCSNNSKPEVSPGQTPKPVTGRQAFQQMYVMARAWAPDAQPIELHSIILEEVKSEHGKAGAWQAAFVSAQRSKSRSYSFSAVEAAGNLHKGVFAGPEEGWSGGARGESRPFPIAALKTDSDDAYQTAAKHSATYIQKHPNQPVLFLLEQTNRFPDLTWRVIWGGSVTSSDHSVFVDASTGKFIETVQ